MVYIGNATGAQDQKGYSLRRSDCTEGKEGRDIWRQRSSK